MSGMTVNYCSAGGEGLSQGPGIVSVLYGEILCTLLEKFWRISLYVTDGAIAELFVR